MFYNTWEAARTTAVKMTVIEEQLEGYKDQLAWAEDYVERLKIAIAKKQEEFDLLAELKMKHK
jgi:hypothetical protein